MRAQIILFWAAATITLGTTKGVLKVLRREFLEHLDGDCVTADSVAGARLRADATIA
jgi:hypothetical protein